MKSTSRTLFRSGLAGLAAVAVAFLSSAARAEEGPAGQPPRHEHLLELGIFGGAHFFAPDHGLGRDRGDPEDLSPQTGFLGGLRLTLNLGPWFSIEGEGAVSPTTTRDDSTTLWVFGYRLNALVNFLDRGPVQPFLLIGGGGLASVSDDTSYVPSDHDIELHAGLGARIPINELFGIRIDGRVLVPPAVASDIVKVGDETYFGGPDFEAMLAVYMNFGVKSPPPPPPPPAPPPPAPPPVDPDPDHDGIRGADDKCPNEAEDKDGFQDEDGCPDPDNDADGILDADDKCPDKAENKNGVDDEDGCPEEDTDGDGFFGSRDKCPDAPETKNGYKDDDGCPDEVPAAVKKFTGVIEGINFKTKSADILKGSYVVLDRAVAVLKEYPDVRLEISGHTDDRGKDEFNMELSQKRADSVRTYLVNKGVPAERLKAVGYGETQPIADNKTESGRAKNRRTEFKLISP